MHSEGRHESLLSGIHSRYTRSIHKLSRSFRYLASKSKLRERGYLALRIDTYTHTHTFVRSGSFDDIFVRMDNVAAANCVVALTKTEIKKFNSVKFF